MATIQISKTKGTETINKTEVTQTQSINVVQTMLHSGLSCITYLRSLFSQKAYDSEVYDASATIRPYAEYASETPISARKPSGQKGAKLKVLRRGRSKRVDLLLDWLEDGAFPALKAGNLRSLEIYVHTDPESREKVVETYTFTIKYFQTEKNGQLLAGLQLDGPGGSSASVGATNEALKELLRQLIAHCSDLPHLPRERYMSMALFYEHDTPVADRPTGFVLNDTADFLFGGAEGWERKERTFEELGSGHHRTSLQMSYLQPLNYVGGAGFFRFQPPTIPDSLRFTAVHDDEAVLSITEADTDNAIATRPRLTTTPSTIIDDEPATIIRAEMATKNISPEHIPLGLDSATNMYIESPSRQLGGPDEETEDNTGLPAPHNLPPTTQHLLSQFDDTFSTQSSNVPQMRKRLRSMMQPENFTQGDTQTQAMSPTLPNGRDETTTPGPPLPPSSGQAALSQSVVKVLEQSKRELRQKAHTSLQAKRSDQTNKDHLILCECGYHETEGDMVQCSYCRTWQHLHCYGYTGQHDERLPEVHVCYGCLLGSDDDDTRARLKDLTLKRRAMHHALTSGLSTQNHLAETIGIPLPAAREVFNFLKAKGYVTTAPRSSTAKHAGSRKVSLVAVKKGSKHDEMLATLCDPLLHISHYYEVPEQSSVEQVPAMQQARTTKAGAMLPPATPGTQLRKRKAAETPASGFDLEVDPSRTPYQTPCRFRAQYNRSAKRSRNSGDVVAATPPRNRTTTASSKRMKSVRTAVMLDATGLSSSPAPSSYEGVLLT